MTTTDSTTTHPHEYLIDGLRALADFLQVHPDLPVDCWANISYSVTVGGAMGEDDTEPAKCAEVDRVAAILGVTPTIRANGDHYTAVLAFGPVVYQATAVTKERLARHLAASTYSGCVTP